MRRAKPHCVLLFEVIDQPTCCLPMTEDGEDVSIGTREFPIVVNIQCVSGYHSL